MSVAALTLPGLDVVWQVRTRHDAAANALADRHYSRRRPYSGQVGPPGRKLVLVTPCERALWLSHWPFAHFAMDGLDAWRCSIFRNEGAGLASDLIFDAMAMTTRKWRELPPDGWVTWIDTRKVKSEHPGYCFKQAGWWLDREWSHRYLIRLRAGIPEPSRSSVRAGRQHSSSGAAGLTPAGGPFALPSATGDGSPVGVRGNWWRPSAGTTYGGVGVIRFRLFPHPARDNGGAG